MLGTKVVAWGPLVWMENHHQVVVVGLGLLMQMGAQPCSPLWVAVGPSNKITKMNRSWDFKDELVDYKTSKA